MASAMVWAKGRFSVTGLNTMNREGVSLMKSSNSLRRPISEAALRNKSASIPRACGSGDRMTLTCSLIEILLSDVIRLAA